MRQAKIHPRTFFELCKLLDFHSNKDVIALNRQGFFKIKTIYHSKLVRELIKVLHQNSSGYYLRALPIELKQPLLDRMGIQETHNDQ